MITIFHDKLFAPDLWPVIMSTDDVDIYSLCCVEAFCTLLLPCLLFQLCKMFFSDQP